MALLSGLDQGFFHVFSMAGWGHLFEGLASGRKYSICFAAVGMDTVTTIWLSIRLISDVLVKTTDILKICIGGGLVFSAANVFTLNEKFYESVVMKFFHKLDPEFAHAIAITAAKYNLIPEANIKPSDILECSAFGLKFKTPLGLAAGFDKNGEAILGLFNMGFSFVEVGSVTPQKQSGNPKPRMFHLFEDRGLINRCGFNNDGSDAVYARLAELPPVKEQKGLVGVNLGKNITTLHPVEDYVQGVKKFGSVADYLVINVSSPNTPGLRNLQKKNELEDLLAEVVTARNQLPESHRPPLLLKISPDLTFEEKKNITDIIAKDKCHVDGLIISNTTTVRDKSLKSQHRSEVGGLSGVPLQKLSTNTIKDIYKLTGGSVPIVGLGGIENGIDAYEKICAGATLLQIYTSLIYKGPPVVLTITHELQCLLQKNGHSSLHSAIGSSVDTEEERKK